MGKVLLVSKPLAPPWNDSSKNLARDVALGMRRHTPLALSDDEGSLSLPRGRVEPVYRGAGRFSPGLTAQLRVLRRLATGPRADLWHFFFAPNPKSSHAGRALSALRRVPTVQSVCSRPRVVTPGLFFADRTVVLSRHTERALHEAGISESRVTRIPPAVPSLAPLTPEARRAARAHFGFGDAPVVVFPGDLELGDGAQRMVEAAGRLRADATLVMACRAKTPGAASAERRLRGLAPEGTRWVGETERIHDLLGCADVVCLPSLDLYGKMDLPLVLLEAMWLARPVLVLEGSPAEELAEDDGAVACPPHALAEALDGLLDDDAARARRGASARRVAQERYEPRAMVDAYESLYDELLR